MRPLSACRSALSLISPSMVPRRFYMPSVPTSQLKQDSSPSASVKDLSAPPPLHSGGQSSADSADKDDAQKYLMPDLMRMRWTSEEKAQLADLVRQGLRIQEIHSYFPHRTICTLDTRICQLRKKIFKTDSMSKDEIREMRRRKKGAFKHWTKEEDEWLRRRVQQQQGSEELNWSKIANGSVEDGRLGRTATSCKRRWAIIDPEARLNHGTWSEEESRKLLLAVCKQLNVAAMGSSSLEQKGLHDLKDMDTDKLHTVDWKVVAEAVGTRSNIQCRSHAYKNQCTGARGRWNPEELVRLERGLERCGQDWHQLAEYVGTRSAYQVKQKYFNWQ
ncbi:DNA binding transcription coactivator transcription factor [Mortierella alpina]|nr:DNA binding transcription coactivator transcription factor [Mortierella alpina]